MLKQLLSALCFIALPLSAQVTIDKVADVPEGKSIAWLGDMDVTKTTCGWEVHQNGANITINGNSITLKDTVYTSGVCVHTTGKIIVQLNGATRFACRLGMDDETRADANKENHCTAEYRVVLQDANGVQDVVQQGSFHTNDPYSIPVDVNTTGWKYLILESNEGLNNWGDHVDWANAYFEYPSAATRAPQIVTVAVVSTQPTIDMVANPTEGYDVAWLGDMDVTKTSCGWEGHQNGANITIDGNPITMKDTIYTSGVCVHATGKIIVKLNGATRFCCYLGIDDEILDDGSGDSRYGIADYRVVLQGGDNSTETVCEGTVKGTDANTVYLDVNTSGWKYLILESNMGELNWGDHVNWANAYFEYIAKAATPPCIVSEEELSSKLACATIVFSQPGVRFMHKIRAAASAATLAVENLPAGLSWNAERSLVEGTIDTEGSYTYDVVVTNEGESTTETISLTVSSKLQQPVPLMGWLSWNVYKAEFDEEKIKATADAFKRYKLDEAGYKYLCIDDNWHADSRNPETGAPMYDTTKFPSGLKAITDYAHNLGLKVGIYSDAADKTCNNEFGSLGYEEIDAKQYAEWGFDLLKYDYCHAPSDVTTARTRYKAMGDALKNCGRDILFYMCEWGQRDPWLWGAETGASCWRATYDSRDQWDAGTYNGSNCGVIQAVDVMKHISVYSGPNRYNDADMMCVGLYGNGLPSSEIINGTAGMTYTEYQSQFAMWCMFASPLTLSFDITNIPQRDLDLITNAELIAINQDRMGQQADLIVSNSNYEIYSKDLENGDIAVAVLNRSGVSRDVTIDFSLLPLNANTEYKFRDLWTHEDVEGTFKNEYTVNVASHATQVFRVTPATAVGINAVAADASAAFKVSADNNEIKVSCPATQGASKRVLISDLAGRVVAQATSTDETIVLPFRAPQGIYVANVVCCGKASNFKFEVK